MKKNIILFLTILLEIASMTPAFSQTYDYVDLFSKRHTITIQQEPAFFAGGDRAIDAEFCAPDDQFVCVISTEFNFAVPIAKKVNVSKWEYRGSSYEMTSQETSRVLGKSFKVWVIESMQGAKKFRYSYSVKHGLIAFSIDMNGESHTFLSQNILGFGHQGNKGRSQQ